MTTIGSVNMAASTNEIPLLEGGNAASHLLRPIFNTEKYSHGDTPPQEMPLTALEKSSERYDGTTRTPITIGMEDFSSKVISFHNYPNSNITQLDASEEGFLAKKTNNIFATQEGQALLRKEGNLFQSDIYYADVKSNGGLQYGYSDISEESDSEYSEILKETAQNFAKAEIEAIESAYQLRREKTSKKDGVLDTDEFSSYLDRSETQIGSDLGYLDLDGNQETFTDKELASYIIAADTNKDGLLTGDEAKAVSELSNEEVHRIASEEYEKYYAKKEEAEEMPSLLHEFTAGIMIQ